MFLTANNENLLHSSYIKSRADFEAMLMHSQKIYIQQVFSDKIPVDICNLISEYAPCQYETRIQSELNNILLHTLKNGTSTDEIEYLCSKGADLSIIYVDKSINNDNILKINIREKDKFQEFIVNFASILCNQLQIAIKNSDDVRACKLYKILQFESKDLGVSEYVQKELLKIYGSESTLRIADYLSALEWQTLISLAEVNKCSKLSYAIKDKNHPDSKRKVEHLVRYKQSLLKSSKAHKKEIIKKIVYSSFEFTIYISAFILSCTGIYSFLIFFVDDAIFSNNTNISMETKFSNYFMMAALSLLLFFLIIISYYRISGVSKDFKLLSAKYKSEKKAINSTNLKITDLSEEHSLNFSRTC